MPGRVESICLAHECSEPTFAVDAATAIAGLGLAGDRLVRKAQESGEPIEPKRQVTLIEREALDALEREYDISLTAGESRRNICTSGVALNHLVGREFRIGSASLRGVELCEPCGLMEKLSGKPGARKGLIHRGGLRAEVVTEGKIRVGDAIEA